MYFLKFSFKILLTLYECKDGQNLSNPFLMIAHLNMSERLPMNSDHLSMTTIIFR